MSVRIHEALVPLLVDINHVHQHPDNPNNGDIDSVVESIQVNGYVNPIIAQRTTGYIEAGNTRYAAMLALGQTQIPVIWVDHDDTGAKRYMLADNQTARLAMMDNSMLHKLLTELQDTDMGLTGSGFVEDDIARILDDMLPEPPEHIGGGFSPNGIYQVVIEFDNESDMHDLAAELIERGLEAREVTL